MINYGTLHEIEEENLEKPKKKAQKSPSHKKEELVSFNKKALPPAVLSKMNKSNSKTDFSVSGFEKASLFKTQLQRGQNSHRDNRTQSAL